MKQKLIAMLELQDAMNSKVNPEWRANGNAWYRAIWVEAAELLDHYGWKWWKKQSPDIEQVALELIDIWHFGLSIVLEKQSDLDACVKELEEGLCSKADLGELREDVEAFALATLQSKAFDIVGFRRLMGQVGLSFDDLYCRYVGKNVLNFFRQDNGYKEGTYIKVWGGREDNEHLVDLVAELDSDASDFRDRLYAGLKSRYPA